MDILDEGFKLFFEEHTKTVEETEAFGEYFSKFVKAGSFCALFGGMGAGKTAFVRGFSRGLNVCGDVFSPTFTIINEYSGKMPLIHCDMYRIFSEEDLYSTGFFDYLDGRNVLIVEWSENIIDFLPREVIKIKFCVVSKDERLIKIFGREGVFCSESFSRRK